MSRSSTYWSVEVTFGGETLVVIKPNSLCGKEAFTSEEREVIREAGRYLLAFIGEEDSEFLPNAGGDE